jgi:hypothetical protein
VDTCYRHYVVWHRFYRALDGEIAPRSSTSRRLAPNWPDQIRYFGLGSAGGADCADRWRLVYILFFRIRNASWPMQPDWDLTQVLAAVLFAGMCASWSVLCAWLLVQTVAERRRYLEEWSRLPIEPTL